MKPVLKLYTRGMMIVFVPLICQILFVCALVWLLLNVHDQVARESHSRDLLNRSYGFGMDAIYSMGETINQKNPKADVSESITLMHRRLNEFAQLAKSDSLHKKQVEKFLRLGEKATRLLATWQREVSPTGYIDSDRLDVITLKSFSVFASLLNTVIEIDSAEQAATAASPIASDQLRDNIWIAFTVMLLGSITAAIALGVFYANSIKEPLQRLTKNSRLLARRDPLLKPIAANDEFGELDRLLHRVSDAVEQAIQGEREMLANAADMIYSLDENGRIQSINPFAEKLVGVEADDIVGQSWLELIYPGDGISAEDHRRSACASEDLASFDLRLKGAGGRLIDSRWTVLWSRTQKILFCIVHDITEQRNLERLKQDYINLVSHDLRSPLMSVQTSMLLIANGGRGEVSPAVQQEVLEAARSIDVLSNLISDLLDLQKLQSGKMQLEVSGFKLKDLLSQSRDLVLPLAQLKNVEIVLPTFDIELMADQSKLRQCTVNLLSNAVKFSPANSKVLIEAERIEDAVEVRVIDRGPGVPEKYRDKIFEAFEQVPTRKGSSEEGTGLGLAICKLLAEAHDGAVGVRAPEGFTGSIFWLRIPWSQHK